MEIEVPTEHLHEAMHHHAHHADDGAKWLTGVALSSAIIAALTAVAALFAGMDANKAILLQMQSADQWNLYQAKGVKLNVLSSKISLLEALGKASSEKDKAKVQEYVEEQGEIREIAGEGQKLSAEHLEAHESMAHAVTLFQVAIAVGAVSALARRRSFWYVSLGAAAVGTVLFAGAMKEHMKLQNADHGLEEKMKAQEEKGKQGSPAHGAHGGGEKKAEAAHGAAQTGAEKTAEPAHAGAAGEAKPEAQAQP